MVFSNGQNWATSSGDWNRQLSTADATNWAYGSDKLESPDPGTLTYHLNDGDPIYTSELTAGDLYPYCAAAKTPTNININDDYNTTKRIDFTVSSYPSNVSAMGLGLSSVNTVLLWDRLTAQFAFDSTGGGSIQQYKIMENFVSKTDYVTFTPSDGDVWSIRWSGAAATGTRLPPPPIVLGGL